MFSFYLELNTRFTILLLLLLQHSALHGIIRPGLTAQNEQLILCLVRSRVRLEQSWLHLGLQRQWTVQCGLLGRGQPPGVLARRGRHLRPHRHQESRQQGYRLRGEEEGNQGIVLVWCDGDGWLNVCCQFIGKYVMGDVLGEGSYAKVKEAIDSEALVG